jgi:poly-gamma-glutamate synthesis protein (capsule biosynthesis protein)
LTVTVTGQSLIKRDISGSAHPGFKPLLDLIGSSDLAFTNFEGTIKGKHGGWPTKPGYYGATDPFVLDVLSGMGFNALSLSNNHAFDLGPNGILSTLDEVASRGFLHAGIGVDATSAAKPGFLTLQAGRIALVAMDAGPMAEQSTAKDATEKVPSRPGVNPLRVSQIVELPGPAFDALCGLEASLGHRAGRGRYRRAATPDQPGKLNFYGQQFRQAAAGSMIGEVDPADRARHLAAIAAAKAEARFVIAYIHHHHWEPVWEEIPGWMRAFAHDCIDAGADLVASHGVPLVQGIEIYRKRPIFFSLGNFIFHSFDPAGWHHDDIWRSVVASCRFAASGDVISITLDPIVLGSEEALREKDFSCRDTPVLAGQDGIPLLRKIAGLSAALGTSIRIEGGRGDIVL